MIVHMERIIVTFVKYDSGGLPFLLIGSIVSAIIQLFPYYRRNDTKKDYPKNQIISLLIASIVE